MSLDSWRSGRADADDMSSRDSGLRRYVRVARERWLLIVIAVIVSIVGAFAFSLTSGKSYQAEAVLQVTPVSADDTTYTGIPVVRTPPDPSRDIETIAGTAGTPPVVAEAQRLLEKTGGVPAHGVSASAVPVANSFLIAVDASQPDARDAARVASAFAAAMLNVRNKSFNDEVTRTISSLKASLLSAGNDPAAQAAVQERIVGLKALQGGPDPSVRLLTEAPIPTSPDSPGLKMVLIAGLLIGLFWGGGAALIADSLLSRVRREAQLRENFDLPVLARIPLSRGVNVGVSALSPRDLDPAAMEGYRTLRQNIEMLRRNGVIGRTIVFTSGEASDGKTTSAINTAAALAESGYRVTLMDLDMRRPSVGQTLGLSSIAGTADVLSGRVPLDEALVVAKGYDRNLSLLLADTVERPPVELMTKAAVTDLLEAAQARADFVVVDTAPLAVVGDALPVVAGADDLFISVRRGHTRLTALRRLIDTLGYHDIAVRGFILIGAERDLRRDENLYYAQETPESKAPQESVPSSNGSAAARRARTVTRTVGRRLPRAR